MNIIGRYIGHDINIYLSTRKYEEYIGKVINPHVEILPSEPFQRGNELGGQKVLTHKVLLTNYQRETKIYLDNLYGG